MFLLKKFWRWWKPVAQAIGNFQAQLILSIFYVVLFSLVGIVYRILSDPFNMRKKVKSSFGPWAYPKDTIETAHRQY